MHKQLTVSIVALFLWVALSPSFAALAVAYVVALVLTEVLKRFVALESIPRAALIGLFMLAAALALSRPRQLVATEGLAYFDVPFRDRAALESDPAIAPRIVFSSQPQTFYVHARGERVRVHIDGDVHETVALGSGLFRLDHRPRRRFGRRGVDVVIDVDGVRTAQRLAAVDPLVRPGWMCSDERAGWAAAVSEDTDEVMLFDRRGAMTRLATGDSPTDCAFANGVLFVTHRYDVALRAYDVLRRAPSGSIALDHHQRHVRGSRRGERLAVSVNGEQPGVFIVDTQTRQAAFSATAFEPEWILFGADDETLLVTDRKGSAIHRLDVQGRRAVERTPPLRLRRPAIAAETSADGRRLFLSVTDFGSASEPHPNHFLEDQLLVVDARTFDVVERTPTFRRDTGSGGSPQQMRATPTGLLAAFLGTGEIGIVDAGTSPTFMRLPIAHPVGLAALGDGVLAVSSPSEGRIVMLDEGMRVFADHALASDGEAAEAALRRAGEAAFTASTVQGGSCQSCHIHSDSDDVRHDIGHAERRPTLSVRGVAGTAPFLRGGSYPNLASLGSVTETILGGYPADRPFSRPALAAYVESLPGFVNPRAFHRPPIEEDRQGLRAFTKARCDLCHQFPAFTSLGRLRKSVLFDVPEDEWQVVLDVPSLLGLRFSAPYLSDGRADTISSVLEDHNRRNTHGDWNALSGDERRTLIAFLQGL